MKALKAAKLCMLAVLAFALSMAAFSVAYADAGENEGVTVYFTVSDDGDFVTGCDGTVLANASVTVEWFDLSEYGLERFTYEQVGSKPTLLHLLIRATEQYYLGREMTVDDFDYRERAMWVTNNPGSLYLKYFWGHDENLLYHVNDKYPMDDSTGVGATCDRIVLEEGDTVDLAMFTNWGISSTGTFAYFKGREFDVGVGEDIVLTGESVGGLGSGAAVFKTAMQNAEVRISRDDGHTWAKAAAVADGEGRVALRFDAPGKYLVSAGPAFSEYENRLSVEYRCVAPPIAVVRVTGEALAPLLVSFDAGEGGAVPSQSVARYGACVKPEDPTRSGYTFEGWYEDPAFAQEYDFGRAVTSDFTLYAKWESEAEVATDISEAQVSAASQVYSGHKLTPEPRVVLAGKELVRGTDYIVSYERNTNAGQGRIVVTGIGAYSGTASGAFTITKAANKLSVKAAKKQLSVKHGKKASFAASKAFKVTCNASAGKLTYELAKVPKKAKKYVKLSAAGKLTVKKGLPRGKYALKVCVTQAATTNYKGKVIKSVALTLRVK